MNRIKTFSPLTLFALILFSGLLLAGAPNVLTAQAAQSGEGGFTQDASQHGGGFNGPGPALVTVDQALKMDDDKKLALRGYIVQSLGDEEYLFKDDSGSIEVEIDRKRWRGQNVTPKDLIEIHGEIDKDWGKTKVDVKRLIKQ
ncbi:MAG: YgiW/YdeI family stress tolerance OB fold protein [Deltaproteobacteria bacterium]|jgi:uncharacterized protein (TIGR00156 family)|nr:YgiW/YdeI family stress tolerance OB fold protein [Deltaproteobacteria bacterium]